MHPFDDTPDHNLIQSWVDHSTPSGEAPPNPKDADRNPSSPPDVPDAESAAPESQTDAPNENGDEKIPSDDPWDAIESGNAPFFDVPSDAESDPRPMHPVTPPGAEDWTQTTDPTAWITDLAARMRPLVQAHAVPEELLAPETMQRLVVLAHDHPDHWELLKPVLTKAVPWRVWRRAFQQAMQTLTQQWDEAETQLILDQLGWDLAHDALTTWEALAATVDRLVARRGVTVLHHRLVKAALALAYPTWIDLLQAQVQKWTNGHWTKAERETWMQQIRRLSPHQPARVKAREQGWDIVPGGPDTTEPSETSSASDAGTASAESRCVSLGSLWPDAPAECASWPLPAGGQPWIPHAEGIARAVRVNEDTVETKSVSFTPIFVRALGRSLGDATDDVAWVWLTWRDGSTQTWKSQWVRRKDALTLPKAAEVFANWDIDFAPGEAKAVVQWLQDQQNAVGRETLPLHAVVTQCGWTTIEGQTAFVLPDAALGVTTRSLVSQIPSDIAKVYRVQGDSDAEAAIIQDALQAEPQLAWALGHAAAAVWCRRIYALGLVDVLGYGMQMTDRTGHGKTFALKLALLPWQQPLPRSANFSTAGATIWLSLFNDLPHGVQETQEYATDALGKPRASAADWPQILHDLSDAGGAIRARVDGSLRMAPIPAGTILFANNQSLLTEATNAGAQVRLLSTGSLFRERSDAMARIVEDLEMRMAQHYGHGGRAVITALLGWSDAQIVAAWQDAVATVRDVLETVMLDPESRQIARRQSKLWALGLLGLRTLLQTGYGFDAALCQRAEAGYRVVVESLTQQMLTTYVPEWRRWWDRVASDLRQHAAEFAGLELQRGPDAEAPREYHGKFDPTKDVLAVEVGWFRDRLQAMGRLDVTTLKKDWAQEGLLIPTYRADGSIKRYDHPTRLTRADGTSYVMTAIWLKASAVGFGVPESDEEDDADSDWDPGSHGASPRRIDSDPQNDDDTAFLDADDDADRYPF